MVDARINNENGKKYWQSIDADVNGMLGGYSYISKVDLQGSKNFLAKLGIGGNHGKKVGRAVDCGAGIGRVAEGLLIPIANLVDIVEPIAKFSERLEGKSGIGQIFTVGLEEWAPDDPSIEIYDLIWNQWCLGHLTDMQLVTYLSKCGKALTAGGWVIVKENLIGDADRFDELDSTVTRTDQSFREIFVRAGLELKRTEIQKGFPQQLYAVRLYALQPKKGQ